MRRRSRNKVPYILPSGDICISPKQVRLHKTSEFLSFALGAPLLVWAGTRDRKLTDYERYGIITLGVGAAIVDPYLWMRFRKAKKKEE